MNVLLVNPPIRERVPAYQQPIGLAMVAGSLRKSGYNVGILDLNRLRPRECDVEGLLPPGPFDWVGISGLITTFKYLKFLIPLLRSKYNAPIVIGGGGFTSAPEVYMDTFHPDLGVMGEGEYTSVDVCKVLLGELHKEDVLGLVYQDNEKVVFTPPRALESNLDNLPEQAYDLLDMDGYAGVSRYAPGKRELSILATRGCPWNCAFCYHIFGRGVRYRSPKKVVDEMQFLMERYGAEAFLFGDECITAKREFVHELCNEILARNLNVEWVCYSRADSLDEETMALMARAGCFFVGYGIESGSQTILDAMNKNIKLEKVKEAYLAAAKYFKHVGVTLIFGMPEETDETIAESVEFLSDLDIGRPFFHLQAYPGTKIFEGNKDKILARHGTFANFFSILSDAGLFSANLTRWSDEEYLLKKFNLQHGITKRITDKFLKHAREQTIETEAARANVSYRWLKKLIEAQPEMQ